MNGLYRLGIDVGATKVNTGIVLEDGTVLDNCTFPSHGYDSAEQLVAEICAQAESLLAANQLSLSGIRHIGVGIPGSVDERKGLVRYSSNLFGENVPLERMFERHWTQKVTIVQDSWAGAWAEYLFGQRKKWPDMLCLTIGTGIGCGVILGKRVYGGAMRTAGEIGHTSIVPNGRPCSCGKRGCLEAYASGTAILKQALERFPEQLEGYPQQAESVFALAYAGNSDALALLEECVDKLAYGLTILINLLSVDVITISGGICIHEALIIHPLAEKIRQYGYPAWAKDHDILVEQAALGSDAPMIGAAFLTKECMM